MSRFRFSATLAAVSYLAFIAVLSPVMAETTRFGTLTAQGTWSVGTVKGKRDNYCATVNTFKADKGDIVLAIARDSSGYGSLAFDFSDALFKANNDYEASLTPGAAPTKRLKGHATTDRSLIVQVGADDAFFTSMSTGGKVSLSLPAASAVFALGSFDAVYKDLVNCATQIKGQGNAVAASDVDHAGQAALSPIDKAAAEIALKSAGQSLVVRKDETLASAAAANPLDEMEAQIDRDAATQNEKFKQAEKQAEARKVEISEQLESQKKEVIALETKKNIMERKLLMSSSSGDIKVRETVSTIDKTAVEKEAAKVEAFKSRETAKKSEKIAEDKTKLKDAPVVSSATVAALTAPPAMRAPEPVEPVKADKALPAIVTEKTEVDAAVVAAEKAAQIEKERSEIKKKLDEELAAESKAVPKTPEQGQKLAQIESQLDQSEKDRNALEVKLKDAQEQSRKTEAALKQQQDQAGKKNEAAQNDARNQQRFEADMQELKRKNSDIVASMKADLDKTIQQYETLKKELAEQKKASESENVATAQQATVIDQLKKELEAKDAQAAKLQKELELAKSESVKKEKPVAAEPATKADPELEQKYSKLNGELEEKQKAIAALEMQMKELEHTRMAEAERAAKAQADLEETRKQMAEMKKAMVEKSANERLAADTAALQTALAMTKSDIDKKEAAVPAATPMPTPTNATATVESTPAAVIEAQQNTIAADTDNKAKQFLDRLVSAHQAQKSGKPVPAMPDVQPAPADIVEQPASLPPVAKIPDVKEEKADPQAVAIAAAQEAHVEKKSFFDRVFSADTNKEPKKFEISRAPDLPVFAGGGITLEKLLGYSGTSRVNFISVPSAPGEVTRQWTSDSIDGLYEQLPSTGNIDVQAKIYLDRYRQDCRNDNLDINMAPMRDLQVGKVIQGTLICNASGNKYATSFVFLEDKQAFHALLHTSYPDHVADLNRITGNLSSTLERADTFLAPQPAMKRPLRAAPAVKESKPVTEVKSALPSFDAHQTEIAPQSNHVDEFGTVIIE